MESEMINQEAESVARRIWLDYVKHHILPPGIPPNPDEVYAKEWRGWCDWLGVDPTISARDLDQVKARMAQ
jgi:hypothetical protein